MTENMTDKLNVGNKSLIIRHDSILIKTRPNRYIFFGLILILLIFIAVVLIDSDENSFFYAATLFIMGLILTLIYYLKAKKTSWKWKLDLVKKFFFFTKEKGVPFSALKHLYIKVTESHSKIYPYDYILVLVNANGQPFDLFKSHHDIEIEEAAKILSRAMDIPVAVRK